MRKSILIILSFLFVSFTYAQSATKPVKGVEAINSHVTVFKIDSAKIALKKQTNTKTPLTVSYYTDFIKSLEEKRDYVLSDQTMTEEAKASGWFVKIEKELIIARSKKESLINSAKND
jgi:hypothetical protein